MAWNIIQLIVLAIDVEAIKFWLLFFSFADSQWPEAGSEIFRFTELFLGSLTSAKRLPETANQAQSASVCIFFQWLIIFSTIPNVLTVILSILDRKLSVLQKQTKSQVGMDKGLRAQFSAWEPVCRSGFASKGTPGGFWIGFERFSKQRLRLDSNSWFGNFENNLMTFPSNIRSRNQQSRVSKI